jgi:GTPase SAR1 family protein
MTRAGYVAVVGRPNVGKSSLLNAFVGEKLSIVTARAQTTRDRVMGIVTLDDAQIIFVDTPGLLEPQYALQHSMLQSALAALDEADQVLLLLDASRPGEPPGGVGLEASAIPSSAWFFTEAGNVAKRLAACLARATSSSTYSGIGCRGASTTSPEKVASGNASVSLLWSDMAIDCSKLREFETSQDTVGVSEGSRRLRRGFSSK